MKKSLIVLASLLAVTAFSGNSYAQFKFGAGYSMANHNVNEGSRDYALHGFNIGATCDIDFINWNIIDFGVVTGLNYELLTDEQSKDLLGSRVKNTVTEHYINVPIQLNLGLNFVPGIFGTYVFGGPSLAFGIASNTETSLDAQSGRGVLKYNNYTGKYSAENIADEIVGSVTGEMSADYGWFDVKLGAGVGLEIVEAVDIRAGYNWGLLNRYTGDSEDGLKHHSDQFYVTLSYMF